MFGGASAALRIPTVALAVGLAPGAGIQPCPPQPRLVTVTVSIVSGAFGSTESVPWIYVPLAHCTDTAAHEPAFTTGLSPNPEPYIVTGTWLQPASQMSGSI